MLLPEEKHAVVQILHPSLFVSDIKAKKDWNRKIWEELKKNFLIHLSLDTLEVEILAGVFFRKAKKVASPGIYFCEQ